MKSSWEARLDDHFSKNTIICTICPRNLYGNRMKYLPQSLFMPPKMTLDEAFMLYGVDYDGLVRFDPKFHPFQRKQFRDLSGGEARIIEMYLIIKSPADFCILDEPFSNIAPVYMEKMRELIREEQNNKGIIVSDHLYDAIIQVSDDIFLLRDGYTADHIIGHRETRIIRKDEVHAIGECKRYRIRVTPQPVGAQAVPQGFCEVDVNIFRCTCRA